MKDNEYRCFLCQSKGAEDNELILFQGYIQDNLEYVQVYVCNICYLVHKDDLQLLISLVKRQVKLKEAEIENIDRKIRAQQNNTEQSRGVNNKSI